LLLQKQVGTGVAGDTKLGENNDFRLLFMRLAQQSADGGDVERGIGNANFRYC
jgi:hypothetical protein